MVATGKIIIGQFFSMRCLVLSRKPFEASVGSNGFISELGVCPSVPGAGIHFGCSK